MLLGIFKRRKWGGGAVKTWACRKSNLSRNNTAQMNCDSNEFVYDECCVCVCVRAWSGIEREKTLVHNFYISVFILAARTSVLPMNVIKFSVKNERPTTGKRAKQTEKTERKSDSMALARTKEKINHRDGICNDCFTTQYIIFVFSVNNKQQQQQRATSSQT